MTLPSTSCATSTVWHQQRNTTGSCLRTEPGFSLREHVDILACITICYAWPTTPYTFLVALVH
eukprot:11247662-Prorocentrum_lima.AAC.1